MRIRFGRAATLAAVVVSLAGAASAALVPAGKAMPAWTGKSTTGKALSSKQLKGKVVLMNFFSYN
jgi:hypothetical protein